MLELIAKAPQEENVEDCLTLPYEQRQKSRQRVCLDSGREAAILLPPGTSLEHGDCLRAADGTLVRVAAANEAVATARTDDPLRLARACYHLGNRHVPLQVGAGWVRLQPDHVLEDMVRGLGLEVIHESAGFEPERGAYPPSHKASEDKSSHSHSAAHDATPDKPHSHGHHH